MAVLPNPIDASALIKLITKIYDYRNKEIKAKKSVHHFQLLLHIFARLVRDNVCDDAMTARDTFRGADNCIRGSDWFVVPREWNESTIKVGAVNNVWFNVTTPRFWQIAVCVDLYFDGLDRRFARQGCQTEGWQLMILMTFEVMASLLSIRHSGQGFPVPGNSCLIDFITHSSSTLAWIEFISSGVTTIAVMFFNH